MRKLLEGVAAGEAEGEVMGRYRYNERHAEYDSDWDELEEMLEKWVRKNNLTFEQKQSLISVRDFIFDRTHTGRTLNE